MPLRRLPLSAWFHRLRRDCRGVSAIEFGFALPVLILLTVGLIDFSLLLWRSSTIENAASEGARFAGVHGASSSAPASAQDVRDFVRSQAVGVPASELSINVTWQPSNQSGSRVTVVLAYNHSFLIGGLVGLDPITISKTSQMTIF